jgi:peroxiredoxin
MKRILLTLSVAALGTFGVLAFQRAAPAAASAANKADVGLPAPDFELRDVYGKTFRLSDFKDRIVVLEWINRDCPVSRGKHDDGVMQKTYRQYAKDDVIWVAVDSTRGRKPDEDRVYAAEKGLAYPILLDPDGKAGHGYGARTTPHMFVIDKKGILAYDGAIDDKGKTNYVAAAIDALLANRPVANAKTAPYGCSVKYK